MNSTVCVAKYCLFAAAAGACALSIALWPPERALPQQSTGPSTTGYLDCARVLADSVEPDLVAQCSMFALRPAARSAA